MDVLIIAQSTESEISHFLNKHRPDLQLGTNNEVSSKNPELFLCHYFIQYKENDYEQSNFSINSVLIVDEGKLIIVDNGETQFENIQVIY